jgi:hypothetical protein
LQEKDCLLADFKSRFQLQTTGNEMHTRKNEKRGHSVSISHPLYSKLRNDYGLDLNH